MESVLARYSFSNVDLQNSDRPSWPEKKLNKNSQNLSCFRRFLISNFFYLCLAIIAKLKTNLLPKSLKTSFTCRSLIMRLKLKSLKLQESSWKKLLKSKLSEEDLSTSLIMKLQKLLKSLLSQNRNNLSFQSLKRTSLFLKKSLISLIKRLKLRELNKKSSLIN